MKKINKSFLFCLLCLTGFQVSGASLFFPDMHPAIHRTDPPDWLKAGKEGDGYLSVNSEVIAENACSSLSESGFWGSEKTQLVISVTSNGFRTKLNKTEIPIATFDGRENDSECASLSSSTVQIIPLVLLGSGQALNSGNLNLVLNVKSSNDSKRDFVGSAKLMLGAAAMVVSGGTATAIGGITSTVGSSVMSETQTRANKLLNAMVDAKVPVPLNWSQLREGISTVEVGVYRSNKNLGDLTDKKIQQLQNDPKAEKTKLFTVKFSFNFTRSLFNPSINSTEQLKLSEDLSPVRVLNFKMQGVSENFLQILNNTSPSLLISLARASDKEFTTACALGFEKLSKIDISSLDTAIIMKSFIDEARGDSSWYNNPSNVRSCFEQNPVVQGFLEKVYGVPEPQFIFGDVQNGVGKSYVKWRNSVGPLLSDFRKALIAKENRKSVLIQYNNNKDIDVSISPEIMPWTFIAKIPTTKIVDTVKPETQSLDSQSTDSQSTDSQSTDSQSADSQSAEKRRLEIHGLSSTENVLESESESESESETTNNSFPGITRLIENKINNIGCFIFKDASNLEPLHYGAYFVLRTLDNKSYLAFARLSDESSIKIKSLNISELTTDWIKHFKSYSYPGGECLSLLN